MQIKVVYSLPLEAFKELYKHKGLILLAMSIGVFLCFLSPCQACGENGSNSELLPNNHSFKQSSLSSVSAAGTNEIDILPSSEMSTI